MPLVGLALRPIAPHNKKEVGLRALPCLFRVIRVEKVPRRSVRGVEVDEGGIIRKMSSLPSAVLDKIPHLPESPGVYLWKDADGTVLYVGKAKRLRSRVRSYANLERIESVGRYALMTQVAAVDTIVVPSEAHALILEANLIKEYKPRFNISLRDDKSYPHIKVTVARAVSARVRHAPARERRVAVLRTVHGREGDAPRAERREAHLHGAELQLRSAEDRAGPPLSRLPHRSVQSALRAAPEPGGVRA